MGGMCSGGVTKTRENSKAKVNDEKSSSGFSGKLKSATSFKRKNKTNNSYPTYPDINLFNNAPHNHLYDSMELGLSNLSASFKSSTPGHKTAQMSSFLGKAGSVGLDVLDTLGSHVSNFNSRGFSIGTASKGNIIAILSFEVANTIVKAANLLESLSEENIQFLKKEVLNSEGVKLLVSTNMKELLNLAATDKREEFDVFSREVIRFGDLCKDPQWHNLGRYFERLNSDIFNHKQSKSEAELTMQELNILAQYTSELYHELHALDRFEQDYRRKLDELESLNLPRRGESLAILHSEVKHQRKVVRNLKKKSLWSKTREEIVEKMVDIVTFIHEEISEAFGEKESDSLHKESVKNVKKNTERLGEAGLALHYASIINQIDNIAARPSSIPPNIRDTLYRGLPSTAKSALRTRLPFLNSKEQLTIPQIKAEMEKTLQWLVPIATDTTKAHQGFGWVGEWANAGNDFRKKNVGNNNVIRLQTLYHADKKKMDMYILELVTLLHRLINLVRFKDNGVKPLPIRSPNCKGRIQISIEDRNLLEKVMGRKKLVPGISKSQEFFVVKKEKVNVWAFSKSTGSSPQRNIGYPKANLLDVLDGLDSAF